MPSPACSLATVKHFEASGYLFSSWQPAQTTCVCWGSLCGSKLKSALFDILSGWMMVSRCQNNLYHMYLCWDGIFSPWGPPCVMDCLMPSCLRVVILGGLEPRGSPRSTPDRLLAVPWAGGWSLRDSPQRTVLKRGRIPVPCGGAPCITLCFWVPMAQANEDTNQTFQNCSWA